MKNFNRGLIGFIVLLVAVYFSVVLTGVAVEKKLSKPTTTVEQEKSKPDCKMTEEKDKDGKIIYKLTGKDCDKVANQVNSEQGQKATCCVCERTSYGVIVCRGNCCHPRVPFAVGNLR